MVLKGGLNHEADLHGVAAQFGFNLDLMKINHVSIRHPSSGVAHLRLKWCNKDIFILMFYNYMKQEGNLFTVPRF